MMTRIFFELERSLASVVGHGATARGAGAGAVPADRPPVEGAIEEELPDGAGGGCPGDVVGDVVIGEPCKGGPPVTGSKPVGGGFGGTLKSACDGVRYGEIICVCVAALRRAGGTSHCEAGGAGESEGVAARIGRARAKSLASRVSSWPYCTVRPVTGTGTRFSPSAQVLISCTR